MDKKITKRDVLTAILAMAEDGNMHIEDFGEGLTDAAVAEYCVKEMENLDKKIERTKAAAAKKREEGDELTEKVYALLTDEFQIIADITAQIDDPEISVNKVTARLSNLVKFGKAEKSEVTVPGVEGQKTRRVMAYRLIGDAVEA